MNWNKLIKLLLRTGTLGVICSLIWWGSFYSRIANGFNVPQSKFISCIYSNNLSCSAVGFYGKMTNVIAYEPLLFWLSSCLIGVGLLVKYSLYEPNAVNKSQQEIEAHSEDATITTTNSPLTNDASLVTNKKKIRWWFVAIVFLLLLFILKEAVALSLIGVIGDIERLLNEDLGFLLIK